MVTEGPEQPSSPHELPALAGMPPVMLVRTYIHPYIGTSSAHMGPSNERRTYPRRLCMESKVFKSVANCCIRPRFKELIQPVHVGCAHSGGTGVMAPPRPPAIHGSWRTPCAPSRAALLATTATWGGSLIQAASPFVRVSREIQSPTTNGIPQAFAFHTCPYLPAVDLFQPTWGDRYLLSMPFPL